jgi:hypothetical protein
MKTDTLMKIQTTILLVILGVCLFFFLQFSRVSASQQQSLADISQRLDAIDKSVVPKKWTSFFEPDVPELDMKAQEIIWQRINRMGKEGWEVISVNRIGTSDKFDILSRR